MEKTQSHHTTEVLLVLNSLEEALNERLQENAFAVRFEQNPTPVSFFDFVDEFRITDSKANHLEPQWQLNGAIATDRQQNAKEKLDRLFSQMKSCCLGPASPIVAVLGLLNAGKSSLVSTFLTEENRQRILVGASNHQGTHRFVLWLPESWRRDANLWKAIEQRLSAVFGCESEWLSESPEVATQQYNDISTRSWKDSDGTSRDRPAIEIPLLAIDTELDAWGIALLDCPDIQTGMMPENASSPRGAEMASKANLLYHEHSQSVADTRLNVLASAAPLCSAFMVVLPANAMHDQTVSRLLRVLDEKMPHVQRMLAVNRVPRKYSAEEIHSEVNRLYGLQNIARCYMAYGFDGPNLRERIPSPPASYRVPTGNCLPLFFRLDGQNQNQPPLPVPDDDWLLNVGSQLDRRALFGDILKSMAQTLMVELNGLLTQCSQFALNSQRNVAELTQVVADACLDFSTDKRNKSGTSEVRLQASRQIVSQISASLERTAPWWAMPGRWTTRIAESGKSNLVSATKWLQVPAWFSGKTEAIGRWIGSRWSSGENGRVVTAELLANCLQQYDRRGLLGLEGTDAKDVALQVQRVRGACQKAIERFQNESRSELDLKQLDQFTAKMWSDMPISKRFLTGIAPAGILFAPLVAVIMMPLDFGGSAVLVFASLKELLCAGAAGVGLVMASTDPIPKIAETEIAWQQLGDLFAVLCDELGLPRPKRENMPIVSAGSTARPLAFSEIPCEMRVRTGESCAPGSYQLQEKSLSKIRELLSNLGIAV